MPSLCFLAMVYLTVVTVNVYSQFLGVKKS